MVERSVEMWVVKWAVKWAGKLAPGSAGKLVAWKAASRVVL